MYTDNRPAPISLPNGAMVILFGKEALFWSSGSINPVYEGLIDGLPESVKQYLFYKGYIEWRDEA